MSSPSRATQAVIFDLDGVLVDSEGLHVDAWKTLFARHGIEVTDQEYRDAVGMLDADWIAGLFGRRGQQTDPAWWQAAKRRVYRGILAANVRLFPGVDVLVRALHAAGLRLAVASSSWRENIHTVLDAAGLAHCFAVLTGKEDVRRHKPHPEPYLRTARALAVPPAACTVVEDSDIGIEAARRAGMRCIAIPNSLPPEQLAAADAILPSLENPDAVLALLA